MPARISSSERLAPWVWLPVGALAVLLIAISGLPGSDCDGSSEGTSLAEVAVAAVACLASVCAIAAGGFRLGVVLFREPSFSTPQAVFAAAAVGVAVLVNAAIDNGNVTFFGQLLIAGTVATGIFFLGLLVTLLARLTVDQAGLLVGVYLLGAGLFVYPIFALLALAANAGAFC